MKRSILLAPLLWVIAISPSIGEEGGSGHYLPGSISSFVDGVPQEETLILRYNLLYYQGEISDVQPLPFAGLIAAGAEDESWANGLMYFGQENGIEASLFAGIDFNTENDATNYQSGTQFHLDGTLAQHFPLFGGLAGVGANGYWYEQVTGDSGAGATFGSFKARTAGLGPALSRKKNWAMSI